MQLPNATIESLQHAYHTLIPISQHMGIQVVSYDGSCLRVTAPLANNINHQQSAFANYHQRFIGKWQQSRIVASEN